MKKNKDYWFSAAKHYSKIYGFMKDFLDINIRGLGFLLRRVRTDHELLVQGKRLYFSHELSEAYARPLHGKWNEPETHHFIDYLIAGLSFKFIEVGANIGEILIDVASNRSCEKAIAFEPNPVAVSIIRKNIVLNSLTNSVVISKALGENRSIQKMNFGSHSPTASLLSTASLSGLGLDVEVSTLDSEICVEEFIGSRILLLIDVEGYELNVIKGGALFIRSCMPLIIFEYHSETKKIFSLTDLQNQLGNDYRIWRLRKDAMLDGDVENAWNCVAIPRNSDFDTILKSRICVASSA